MYPCNISEYKYFHAEMKTMMTATSTTTKESATRISTTTGEMTMGQPTTEMTTMRQMATTMTAETSGRLLM